MEHKFKSANIPIERKPISTAYTILSLSALSTSILGAFGETELKALSLGNPIFRLKTKEMKIKKPFE